MESQHTINKNIARTISFLNHHFWVIPILFSVMFFFITTNHGIGLSPDSIAYLGVAENITNGSGITVPYGLPPNQPLTQFPPLLPILLSLIAKLGFSMVTSAKILNLILITAFFIITYLILKLIDPRPSVFRSVTFLFIAIFISSTYVFSMLWSEPLMIVLGLSGFLVFYYSQTKNNFLYALYAGVIFALTVAARYAGITYLFSALFFVLISVTISLKRKLLLWFLLSVPTITFLSVWILRDIGNGISSTGRSLNFNPLNISHIHQLLNTISGWFQLPNTTFTILKFFIYLFVFAFFLTVSWGLFFSKSKQPHNIGKVFTVFVIIYSLFILISIMFLDSNIPLDTRILSPVLVIFLLMIVIANKFDFLTIYRVKNIYKVLVALIPIFTIVVFLNNFALVKQAYQNGIGFNSLAWKNFESLKYVNKLNGDYLLISNAPEPVFYYTNHEVYSLPKKFLSMQQEENVNYQAEIQELISTELVQNTYFIFFHDIKGGSDSDISALQTKFQFDLDNRFPEATIYKYIPRNK